MKVVDPIEKEESIVMELYDLCAMYGGISQVSVS